MSVRISMLRDALRGLIDAVSDQDVALPDSVARALEKATAAHHATRFIAPEYFPVVVGTRSGAVVTLLAMHEGRLIGTFHDGDGFNVNSWHADGTMFGADDPDEFDLVVPPDDEPVTAGCTVIPFMGRVS